MKRCQAGNKLPKGCKNFFELPANAQAYIARLETLVGVPADIISTGPDRVDTIIKRHPFA